MPNEDRFDTVPKLLDYLKEQLGTVARTVPCRYLLQLEYLAFGNLKHSSPLRAYEDEQCIANITEGYHGEFLRQAWENFDHGKIPENWKELLYGILSKTS